MSLLCVLNVRAQETRPVGERPGTSARGSAAEPSSSTAAGPLSQETQAAAPRLLKFTGVLTEVPRTPLSSPVEMTLALYRDEVGGEPLWTEMQSVEIDKQGHYTVLLGATQAEGLPVDLFPSGEARWLAVEIPGQAQQPRALLVGVPYALKAADAEKLAGKSASDFVLSKNLSEQVRQVIQAQPDIGGQAASTGTLQPGQTKTSNAVTPQMTPTGPVFPPSTFSGTNATQIVSVQQNGSGNGLYAQTTNSTGSSAVVGVATSSSSSSNQNGVIGFNAGAGSGVAGIATNPSSGVGIYGQSANFAGVFGNAITTSGFSNGVFGQTASPDGSGVNGNNNATTGFARGVNGFSASPNGTAVFGNDPAGGSGVFGLSEGPNGTGTIGSGSATGVFGSADGPSGFTNGVFGQSFSTSGTGVGGFANAISGFTSGVSGDASASPNGTGVFGSSFQWVGVGGQATATSGGPAFGVWGDSLSTNGIGVAGFEDATSGPTAGVQGTSVSGQGSGVIGINNSSAADFNNGVLGINHAATGNAYGVEGFTATNGFGAGVLGNATSTSGTPFGVFGQSASPNAVAVFGHSIAPSGGVGLEGWTEGPNAVAGTFVAHSGSGLILQGVSGSAFNTVFSVDAAGNLNISGNLYVAGSKSSTVQLKSGREVALYAVESPENWFEDFGSAELRGGVAWVPLEASFNEATNAAITYHVFLTPNGDSNGLYVARKTAAGFEVREHGGGGSNVAFDYRIVVRRRGYETIRMAEVQHDVKTSETARQHLNELANSGTLKKRGVVETPRNIASPAIRPAPRGPAVPAQATRPVTTPVVPQIPKINIPQRPHPKAPQPGQPR